MYTTTHQINLMLENINLLKSQSLVSVYINIPKLKDQIETVMEEAGVMEAAGEMMG
jgi:hypothetical protein